MLEKIITRLANTEFSSRIKFSKFLEDIPNSYFIDYYKTPRTNIISAIIIISTILSLLSAIIASIHDLVFGLLIFIVVFLASILFFIRKIRKKYLNKILEVEQYSDLICREMILIFTSTQSLGTVLEYLSKGDYPYISKMLHQMIKEINVNATPVKLFRDFANKQPSETIREFILESLIPMAKGNLKIEKSLVIETQWRIRQKFNSYMSQIEGKLSIFLAITTIIPITISMLLVMLGHINLNLLIFLPLLFFIFDLIAVEVFNSGRTQLLGG